MKKIFTYRLLIIILFVIGSIWPFIPALTIILLFFLLIPLALAILITIITYLMGVIASNKLLKINALKVLSAILIFLVSQFLSVFIIDKLLNYKSEQLIAEINRFKIDNGKYPTTLDEMSSYLNFGIEYNLDKDGSYELEYSRGFMVREVYSSTQKDWESYGWND